MVDSLVTLLNNISMNISGLSCEREKKIKETCNFYFCEILALLMLQTNEDSKNGATINVESNGNGVEEKNLMNATPLLQGDILLLDVISEGVSNSTATPISEENKGVESSVLLHEVENNLLITGEQIIENNVNGLSLEGTTIDYLDLIINSDAVSPEIKNPPIETQMKYNQSIQSIPSQSTEIPNISINGVESPIYVEVINMDSADTIRSFVTHSDAENNVTSSTSNVSSHIVTNSSLSPSPKAEPNLTIQYPILDPHNSEKDDVSIQSRGSTLLENNSERTGTDKSFTNEMRKLHIDKGSIGLVEESSVAENLLQNPFRLNSSRKINGQFVAENLLQNLFKMNTHFKNGLDKFNIFPEETGSIIDKPVHKASSPCTVDTDINTSISETQRDMNLFHSFMRFPSGENGFIGENKDILKELGAVLFNKVHGMVHSGMKTVRIQLEPEHLGLLEIKVHEMNGQYGIKVSTSTPEVHRLISTQLPQLQESLRNEGVSVRDIQIVLSNDTIFQPSTSSGGSMMTNGHEKFNLPGISYQETPEERSNNSSICISFHEGNLDIKV